MREPLSEDEAEELSPRMSRWMGLIMAAAAMPLYVAFVYFKRENVGYVVGCITIAFLGVIYVNRSTALRPRFVAELSALYVLHVFVILNLPLPSNIPSYVMFPIALADGLLVLGAMHLLQHLGRATRRG